MPLEEVIELTGKLLDEGISGLTTNNESALYVLKLQSIKVEKIGKLWYIWK